jgi:hypothetical protein
VTIPYTRISGSDTTSGGSGITTVPAEATVYKCTVGEKDYYMPIATLEDGGNQVGELNWDLSPLGMMEEGATYKMSFVVWPNQEAYDYVADLNNGKKSWNESTQTGVYDAGGTLLYYKGGVSTGRAV